MALFKLTNEDVLVWQDILVWQGVLDTPVCVQVNARVLGLHLSHMHTHTTTSGNFFAIGPVVFAPGTQGTQTYATELNNLH
jgi:hypothetical protein